MASFGRRAAGRGRHERSVETDSTANTLDNGTRRQERGEREKEGEREEKTGRTGKKEKDEEKVV